MTNNEIITELEQIYNNASIFDFLILIFFFSLVGVGAIILIDSIRTVILFVIENITDIFWKWKNADITKYSQRRYEAFKKKQFKE